MTDEEARIHQLAFRAEVERLLKIKKGNPFDKRLWHSGKARQLGKDELRYYDWCRAREDAGLPIDLLVKPSAPAHWSDDI